ncbi:hypothetical protein TEA_015312 [Camellia sinensis var. sinensis]|uniref:Protein kinase domain-containing protein n=1 Tax=Camellia sinensis var. sinensis TaxID=542762 RepID=A0A4S4EZC2_CAMSN|nr:hypothetical protein TEA_015312 [Camellia sinensis var. sinensis]
MRMGHSRSMEIGLFYLERIGQLVNWRKILLMQLQAMEKEYANATKKKKNSLLLNSFSMNMGDTDYSMSITELLKLPMSNTQRLMAASIIVKDEDKVDLFFSLDENDKMEWVSLLLEGWRMQAMLLVLGFWNFFSIRKMFGTHVPGEPNIFAHSIIRLRIDIWATEYTTAIDMWSADWFLTELLLGQILGTPTREEIRCMNPNYTEFKFPQIKAHPWHKVFNKRMPAEAVDLVSRLLQYSPNLRCTALEACAHPFFDDLREPTTSLPNGRPLPPLFNFTSQELAGASRELCQRFIPEHVRK